MTGRKGPTALYRHFAAGGGLLYVGISRNPESRSAEHASISPWWPLVARTTVEWLPTRADAEDAEDAAIKAERPRYNRAGSDSPMNLTRDFGEFNEMAVSGLRNRFADVMNAATRGRVTYVTSRGRIVATIGPPPLVEDDEEHEQ